jgi:hypothetical protein
MSRAKDLATMIFRCSAGYVIRRRTLCEEGSVKRIEPISPERAP